MMQGLNEQQKHFESELDQLRKKHKEKMFESKQKIKHLS